MDYAERGLQDIETILEGREFFWLVFFERDTTVSVVLLDFMVDWFTTK
jgi:hypothetical protein